MSCVRRTLIQAVNNLLDDREEALRIQKGKYFAIFTEH
jgi:hypothetical protein